MMSTERRCGQAILRLNSATRFKGRVPDHRQRGVTVCGIVLQLPDACDTTRTIGLHCVVLVE